MKIEETKEILEFLDKNKDMLLPIVKSTIALVETFGAELDQSLQKVFIDKSVEYTAKKFKLLLKNGFTRKEALAIIIHDKEELKTIATSRSSNKK